MGLDPFADGPGPGMPISVDVNPNKAWRLVFPPNLLSCDQLMAVDFVQFLLWAPRKLLGKWTVYEAVCASLSTCVGVQVACRISIKHRDWLVTTVYYHWHRILPGGSPVFLPFSLVDMIRDSPIVEEVASLFGYSSADLASVWSYGHRAIASSNKNLMHQQALLWGSKIDEELHPASLLMIARFCTFASISGLLRGIINSLPGRVRILLL